MTDILYNLLLKSTKSFEHSHRQENSGDGSDYECKHILGDASENTFAVLVIARLVTWAALWGFLIWLYSVS
ncbi:MAG: hypothetical protein HQK51_11630 [Oligoflexia bacterium]|nr:hypothetical protein [Oligoflexia bacterium]